MERFHLKEDVKVYCIGAEFPQGVQSNNEEMLCMVKVN